MAIKMEPSFTVSIRGYDREEVDEYIQSLRELTSQANERADQAEQKERDLQAQLRWLSARVDELEDCIRNETPRTIDALGERINLVLHEAEAGADTALSRARAEAEAIVEDARRRADSTMEKAAAQAAEMEQTLALAAKEAQGRARMAEEEAKQSASAIVAAAERRANDRLAQVQHWAAEVVARTEAEQRRHLEAFTKIKTRHEETIAQLISRREEVLSSMDALGTSLRRAVEQVAPVVQSDHPSRLDQGRLPAIPSETGSVNAEVPVNAEVQGDLGSDEGAGAPSSAMEDRQQPGAAGEITQQLRAGQPADAPGTTETSSEDKAAEQGTQRPPEEGSADPTHAAEHRGTDDSHAQDPRHPEDRSEDLSEHPTQAVGDAFDVTAVIELAPLEEALQGQHHKTEPHQVVTAKPKEPQRRR